MYAQDDFIIIILATIYGTCGEHYYLHGSFRVGLIIIIIRLSMDVRSISFACHYYYTS